MNKAGNPAWRRRNPDIGEVDQMCGNVIADFDDTTGWVESFLLHQETFYEPTAGEANAGDIDHCNSLVRGRAGVLKMPHYSQASTDARVTAYASRDFLEHAGALIVRRQETMTLGGMTVYRQKRPEPPPRHDEPPHPSASLRTPDDPGPTTAERLTMSRYDQANQVLRDQAERIFQARERRDALQRAFLPRDDDQ